ncbi:MAG: O-methyltransferase [candidate division Zixibacteria bacterium]|nr:O-methyltransferase [candidate division Zixibacteria bacterium]
MDRAYRRAAEPKRNTISMKYITNPKIEKYIQDILSSDVSVPESEVFERMHAYARVNKFPIIGPQAGRFLRQLALISNARRVLELGSGYGYSALWFAGGMDTDGKIVCTDNSEKNRELAVEYFNKTHHLKLLDYRVGDALEIARDLSGPFDIILNDVHKEQYPEVFDIAVRLLRKGGIFISDNVLWSGRILDPKPDLPAQAVLEFNRRLFNSPGIFSSIIPIRDGLGMAVKIT